METLTVFLQLEHHVKMLIYFVCIFSAYFRNDSSKTPWWLTRTICEDNERLPRAKQINNSNRVRPLFGQILYFFLCDHHSLRILPFVVCAHLAMCFTPSFAHFSAHENKINYSQLPAAPSVAISTHRLHKIFQIWKQILFGIFLAFCLLKIFRRSIKDYYK